MTISVPFRELSCDTEGCTSAERVRIPEYDYEALRDLPPGWGVIRREGSEIYPDIMCRACLAGIGVTP